jgi:hypothetical protein
MTSNGTSANTAHKLGLTIPQMVLFQADKIIR